MANSALNFLKCALLIITGRLSDDLPAIFNSNYSTLMYWRDEWNNQGYSKARVNSALIQAQRHHLRDHAAKQYESIISRLEEGFTWQDLYTALYEAFFNDAYKSYQQSQFQATPLYDPTKGPLSRYLNSLYNHLTRAGVEDEAALDLQFKSKLTGDVLTRWRNHLARPENDDVATAPRNLTAEDELSFTPAGGSRKRRATDSAPLNDRLGPGNSDSKRFYTGGGACRVQGHFFGKTSDGKHKSYHLWKDCSQNPANNKSAHDSNTSGNGSQTAPKKFNCMCGSPDHKFFNCPKKAAILKAAAQIGAITETFSPFNDAAVAAVQETTAPRTPMPTDLPGLCMSDDEMETFATPSFNELDEANSTEDLAALLNN